MLWEQWFTASQLFGDNYNDKAFVLDLGQQLCGVDAWAHGVCDSRQVMGYRSIEKVGKFHAQGFNNIRRATSGVATQQNTPIGVAD